MVSPFAAGEREGVAVEGDEVGPEAGGDGAGGAAGGPGAAGDGALEEDAAGGGVGSGEDGAGAVAQALGILQRAKLLGEADADVRVGADAEGAAGAEIGRAVEDAVAEARLR